MASLGVAFIIYDSAGYRNLGIRGGIIIKSISSSGKELSQAYCELRHEQLEQLVVKLIEKVEGISKLSLDPEADSSYSIDFTVHLFPPFWNKLEKIELKGIEV